MGVFITPTRALFCIRSPEGNFLFLRGEDFSGFFLKPFPRAITAAAVIITAIIIITIIITAIFIIITITSIAISGTVIRVKVFPVRETF